MIARLPARMPAPTPAIRRDDTTDRPVGRSPVVYGR